MNEPTSQRDKTVAISKSIETGERYPWSYLDSRRYIQHNLNLGDGLGAILQFVDSLPAGTSKVDAVRAFEDGDFSFSHLEYYLEPYGHTAGFEVHRWEDGRVVEHWDNLQPIADATNPSGRTMFDGATEITDLHLTDTNKAIAENFVTDVLIDREESKIGEYLAENFESHRPDYGDGPDEVRRQLDDAEDGGLSHLEVRRVLGEGNFALVMSSGTRNGEPAAIFDLFRIAAGKIAEHWDVVEMLPPRSQWQNTNGKF